MAPEAIVLAGGLGTRLRAVLPDAQKVMARIADQPFVAHVLRHLAGQGVTRAVLAAGHHGDQVAAWAATAPIPGLSLAVSREHAPLGTGGAARLALDLTRSDPVLILNGDSFVPFDLAALERRLDQTGATVALAAVAVDDAGRYGALDLDPADRVTAFREKAPDRAGQGWINAGVYLARRAALAGFAAGQAFSLEKDLFPRLTDGRLVAVRHDAPFLDIGTPETLAKGAAFVTRVLP